LSACSLWRCRAKKRSVEKAVTKVIVAKVRKANVAEPDEGRMKGASKGAVKETCGGDRGKRVEVIVANVRRWS
jgi:hypothetical protein